MITRSNENSQASLRTKKTVTRSVTNRTDHYATWGKRIFDIVFASIVLTVFSPLYLAIAILVFISSRGSVLYIHPRVGLHGQEFKCIKFRTMINGADQVLENYLNSCPISRAEYEASFKLKHDPRITKIGKFLRTTSLDELPQFWNVLVGDMSVVGPRPLVRAELIKYGSSIDKVLSVRPGIAGLWQVSGRNDIPYSRRIQIDASYVRLMSFWLDVKLIFKTILVVIFPKGNGAY
ncbi:MULTISPECIES: sugar transferase [unclassified Pseudanabaena]|uniref:sugar transferase n=1 Tax=unclassified Pseudanabaena TaxID=2593292 RepID=UPI000DC6D6DE|nr:MULTISPECIES: sugar transferase [unclassified Pseudanabaena]BBC23522.1 undecaprenyl-phosphate galactosephosphotransferase [Pseudanabaena sp. ABRG5-3]